MGVLNHWRRWSNVCKCLPFVGTAMTMRKGLCEKYDYEFNSVPQNCLPSKAWNSVFNDFVKKLHKLLWWYRNLKWYLYLIFYNFVIIINYESSPVFIIWDNDNIHNTPCLSQAANNRCSIIYFFSVASRAKNKILRETNFYRTGIKEMQCIKG